MCSNDECPYYGSVLAYFDDGEVTTSSYCGNILGYYKGGCVYKAESDPKTIVGYYDGHYITSVGPWHQIIARYGGGTICENYGAGKILFYYSGDDDGAAAAALLTLKSR